MKHGQVIHSIGFRKLKHLIDVAIPLDEHRITAIMGPNCSGKTTVIHALACCYQPEEGNGENHKFSEYFTPSTYERWKNSKFNIEYSYKDGSATFDHVNQEYSKDERWVPKYDRRPVRPVYYLGVNTSVPLIEKETQKSNINFTELLRTGGNFQKMLENMSEIFNRSYSELYELNRYGKHHKGVKCSGIKYSELTMGAGEQRIFKILEIIINSPKYSLILIDEIDLLMHQYALEKLVDQLNILVEEKKHQLIFTSHNQHLARIKKRLKVLHLYNTPSKTFLLKDTNMDAIFRLSGYSTDLRPYEIYVEDFVSMKIIETLLDEKKIKRHVKIIQFGSAINAFTIAAGAILKDANLDKKLFVLDGDVESMPDEIEKNINRVLTGNVEPHITYRLEVSKRILIYNTGEGESPEHYLSEAIKALGDEQLNESGKLIKSMEYKIDKHKYITDLEDQLGVSKEQAIINVIANAKSNEEKWSRFVSVIDVAINNIKQEIELGQ